MENQTNSKRSAMTRTKKANRMSENYTDDCDLEGTPIERVPHHRLDKTEDFDLQYRTKKLLGQGSFGKVELVEHIGTNAIYAAKTVKKKVGKTDSMVQLDREVLILKKIRNPYIMGLKEVFETSEKVIMILEYCNGGDLMDFIKNGHIKNEAIARMIFKQMTEAVAYLHDHGVVHRDIKPANILLAKHEDSVSIRISDFGLVTFIDACDTIDNTAGTPFYMAPEVMNGNGYSQQCDIWSLGVILYELLIGIYSRGMAEKLYEMIKAKQIGYPTDLWHGISPEGQQLVQLLLKYNAAERLTAREILRHAWINNQQLNNNDKLLPNVIDMMRSYNAERRFKKLIFVVFGSVIFARNSEYKWTFPEVLHGSAGVLSSDPALSPTSSGLNGSKSGNLSSIQISKTADISPIILSPGAIKATGRHRAPSITRSSSPPPNSQAQSLSVTAKITLSRSATALQNNGGNGTKSSMKSPLSPKSTYVRSKEDIEF